MFKPAPRGQPAVGPGDADYTKCSKDMLPVEMFEREMPPMGIYETLYAFEKKFGQPMNTHPPDYPKVTHPWSQGFPLTVPLPELPDSYPGKKCGKGMDLPSSVECDFKDRFYPKAPGLPELREAIAGYFNTYYTGEGVNPVNPDLRISKDNVMIFHGGRSGVFNVLAFLKESVHIRIGQTEWPAYLDIMTQTNKEWNIVPCHAGNLFHPQNSEYFDRTRCNARTNLMAIISNPGNPSGHARAGEELKELMGIVEGDRRNALLLDEAYEMFHDPSVCGLQYIKDLENSNIFLCGACTKGLQCPGIRLGWVIASTKNIEQLGNFSSFGMGGVSHLSQRYALKLFEPARIKEVRAKIQEFYAFQRERYGKAFKEMGLEMHTGTGGFYHWMRLPEVKTPDGSNKGLDCREFNQRLFKRGAAILEGPSCDMGRPHDKGHTDYVSPYTRMFRFSFGPLHIEDFESDIKIMKEVLEEYKADVAAGKA